MTKRATSLNEKQERFCREYLKDTNGKQAAIRAGYSPKSAHTTANELLNNPKVILFIDAQQKRMAAKMDISIEKVVEELAKVGFANLKNYIDSDGGVKDITELEDIKTAALQSVTRTKKTFPGRGKDSEAITEVETKISLHDKIAALDKLMRHLGGYNDKLQISAPDVDVILPEMLKKSGNQADTQT